MPTVLTKKGEYLYRVRSVIVQDLIRKVYEHAKQCGDCDITPAEVELLDKELADLAKLRNQRVMRIVARMKGRAAEDLLDFAIAKGWVE